MELETLKNLLSQPLADNPERLKNQLIEIESWHSRLVEMKRKAMQEKSPDKGLLSDYENVISKRLSLGQTLLRSYTEELKRSL